MNTEIGETALTQFESNPESEKLPNDPVTESGIDKGNQKAAIIGGIIAVLVIIGIIVAFVFLLRSDNEVTSRVRDVFIIFMALEFLVVGFVLIILVIQLARLTNLLQNEVKPILDSTNETVSTLRGTTRFLSDNLVEPVIKLNEYLAGFQSVLNLVRPARKNKD